MIRTVSSPPAEPEAFYLRQARSPTIALAARWMQRGGNNFPRARRRAAVAVLQGRGDGRPRQCDTSGVPCAVSVPALATRIEEQRRRRFQRPRSPGALSDAASDLGHSDSNAAPRYCSPIVNLQRSIPHKCRSSASASSSNAAQEFWIRAIVNAMSVFTTTVWTALRTMSFATKKVKSSLTRWSPRARTFTATFAAGRVILRIRDSPNTVSSIS